MGANNSTFNYQFSINIMPEHYFEAFLLLAALVKWALK